MRHRACELWMAATLVIAIGCASGGRPTRTSTPRASVEPPNAGPSTASQNDTPQRSEPSVAVDPATSSAPPAPPSTLLAYRASIDRVLSAAARARLAPPEAPALEAACHAEAFAAVLTDAVARHIAVPAFRRLGPPYVVYAKLAADALPLRAHTAVEWNNFTIASPSLGRCEGEDLARLSAFCQRAQLADVIGTAVSSQIAPTGKAEGSIPTGDGTSESWSIELKDVLDAAEQLGVRRATAEQALLAAYELMRVQLRQPCELLEKQQQLTLAPIVLHVATRAGAPVIDEAALREWLAVAEAHFELAGIAFAPELRTLPEGFGELRRVRDRHALKRFLVPRHINVFVVAAMLDPVASATTKRAAAWQGFEPTGRLAGAHIEVEGALPKTYVIVSTDAGSALSLTHELGHFFGAAHHRDPLNIMSYGTDRQRFEDAQLQTFDRTLRALIRARALAIPQ